MTTRRLIAIAAIYVCTTIAWFALGTSVVVRSGEYDYKLAQEVTLLWGGQHLQSAPEAWAERPRTVTDTVETKDDSGRVTGVRELVRTVIDRVPAPLVSTRADVRLALDQRRKGLLWYDTYGVVFHATYRFRNPDAAERPLQVRFIFPSKQGIYDDFTFSLNGRPAPPITNLSEGVQGSITLAGGQDAVLEVGYRSRGLGDWRYAFASSGVAQVRDFLLTMRTDFDRIDFPAGTMSPGAMRRHGAGWTLDWRFGNLVTGQQLGMDLPNRINPGPLASRITFFAPVSLLFFLTVLVMLGVIRGENLHPMNYFFLACAFFAFHLLLAYLVDHVSINLAFVIAAAVSLALVVSYLRIVTGMRRALLHAGAAQLVFLVLFSYAFFFEGYTGLTVTIGAVITLFVLMQLTAHVRWQDVFSAGTTTRLDGLPTPGGQR